MNISIIGASSGVGLLAAKQALAKGHRVTTLSRTTATLPTDPLLVKISGTATSVSDLKKAIAGADAILVTIGKSKDKLPSLFPDTAHALIRAAKELQLNVPILVITGFGAGNSMTYNKSLFIKLVIGWVLKKEYAYKTEMEKILAQSDLNWQIVRPGMLTNGPLTKHYQVIPKLHERISVKKIARADVAHFMLSQAEQPDLMHHYVTLTY